MLLEVTCLPTNNEQQYQRSILREYFYDAFILVADKNLNSISEYVYFIQNIELGTLQKSRLTCLLRDHTQRIIK